MMKNLFYEENKINRDERFIFKHETIDNVNTQNINQELKPLFIKSGESTIAQKSVDSLNQELKPLFAKSGERIIEEKSDLNQELKPLFKKLERKNIKENKNHDLNQKSNKLFTVDTIIKSEESDDLKSKSELKVNKKDNLESSSNLFKSKNQFPYLYRNIVNIDCIRIIDNNMYIYIDKYGYLKHIKKSDEEIEINRLIPREYREQIHPNMILAIIRKLKSDPELQISNEEINKYKGFINCKNGVVDVMNGMLIPHDKKYKFTYVINANYDITYLNNQHRLYNFNRFIETSLEGNREKIQLLMEIISYLISGYSNAKRAFMMIGKPHTGKSVLSRLISYMIGEENVSNISMHKLGDRFSIAQYKDKKVNICAEISSVDIKNIDVFKAITGNDYLAGEFKGQDMFYYKSQIKLLFCGNQMPNISEDESTSAFIDRLIFLKFNTTIPRDKIDYELEDKLKREVDGIFTVSIRYLENLVRNNFEFIQPKDSIDFLHNYKNQQNHIEEFVDEYCNIGEDQKVHTCELYETYRKYCSVNYINAYNLNKFQSYIMTIYDSVVKSKFRMNGENRRGFKGIGLKKEIH